MSCSAYRCPSTTPSLPALSILLGLAALLSVLATPATAQLPLEPEWTTRWTAVPDARKDRPQRIEVDAVGNSYVVGSSSETALSTSNIVVASYDPDGNQRWVDVVDFGDQEIGDRLTFDPNGDLLVVGVVESSFYVIRYNPATGQRLDEFSHDGGGGERPYDITTDAAGNVYICGSSWPPGGDNQNDFYTVKLDPVGTALWSARYNGLGAFLFAHDAAYDLMLDAAGDLFVTGYSNAPGGANGDYLTIKYDGATGQELWNQRFSDGSNENSYEMAMDPVGDIYVTGKSYNSGYRYQTIKYANADGAILWTAWDMPQACSRGGQIALDSQGDVYLTGTADPDCNESNTNDNIVTIKHRGSDGAHLWTSDYGSYAVGFLDVPTQLVIDSQDRVFVTGESVGSLILLEYDPQTGEQVGLGLVDGAADERLRGMSMVLDSRQDLLIAAEARNGNTENRDFVTFKFATGNTQLFADDFENGTMSGWSVTIE